MNMPPIDAMRDLMLKGFQELMETAVWNMKQGVAYTDTWHTDQEDDQAFVVIDLALPQSDDLKLYIEIDGDTYGTLTGIRIPVGKTYDFPKVF
jgi:hypothetical protein